MRRRMLLDQKPKGALYWYGDECTDITGGWVRNSTYPSGTITKASDHMELAYDYYGSIGNTVGIKLNNNINITEYTTAYIECYTPQANYRNFAFAIYDDSTSSRGYIYLPNNLNDYVISSLDITNKGAFYGLMNFWIYGRYYSQPSGTLYIKRIWLE